VSAQSGVAGVHDLHVWGTSTTENSFSAHRVIPTRADSDEILATLAEELQETFEITHPTLQIESGSTPLPSLNTACDNQKTL
jgi:cobalt-zinc-cadmium efflux system protein